ncbi:T9SS-dependent choice-of-anchor J family protein [Flavobacterium pallidum]|nr:choice-of-anchor J domain-containing protein [Flavobacterium pallidum]
MPQTISDSNWTVDDYAQVSNIAVGSDYVFTCSIGATENYITVTDLSDNIIASGESPLTVNAIAADEVKLHYSDDAACAGSQGGHTTTLQIILTCPVPLNVMVTNILMTSADFIWEAGGAETAWEVLVLPEGSPSPGPSTSGTPVTTMSYTATALTQATDYVFYVRANCGSEFSPWTLATDFTTACNGISAFNESFDGVSTPDLPTCWNTIIRGAELSEYAQIGTENFEPVHSGPNAVRLDNSDSSGDYDLILVSPNLSNLGAGTHRIKFYASGFANLQVGTLDNFSDSAVFTPLEEVSITEDATQYTVDFSGYTGTDTYIGFRMNSTDIYTSIFIDDILWEQNPTCPDVTEITIPAIGTATATVSWVAGGSETAWQIAVGPTSVSDPNTLTPLASADVSKDITGLTDNTDYKVWVRSMCAGGTDAGAWIGPVTFTTACLPIANFYENFDSVNTPELPGCWTAILRGPTISDYATINTVDFDPIHSAPNSVEMYNSSSETAGADDIILVSPNLSTLGSGTHRMKFYAKNPGSLQVGTMDMNSNDGMFSIMEEITTTSQTAQYTVDFSSYSGSDTYVAIRLNNSDMYTSIELDDIKWEVNPSCPDVTDVTVPATTIDGATVNWIANGGEASWNIAVGPASTTDPDTLTFVTSTSETKDITGLTDNTDYKVWVRSVCAGNDNGAWIGPVSFTTACIATANFSENFDSTNTGDLPGCWTAILRGPSISEYANVGVVDWTEVHSNPNSVQLNNDNSDTTGDNDVILVSPNLSTLSLGTYRLKFYAKYTGNLQIGTMDSNTDSGVFNLVEEISTVDAVTEYKIDFSTYTGSDTYVAIRLNSGPYTSIFLDNIVWEISPTCPDVTEVMVNGVTTSTADVSWVSNGTESQWQTAYTLATVNDPTTATPASSSNQYATISGLTPATQYNVWVRSVCAGGTDLGAWIGPVQFSTLCEPVGLPFVEDFESATAPGLPICGNVVNLGAGNEWYVGDGENQAVDAGFTSKTLTYMYDFDNGANTWYFTGGMMLQAGVDYNISYRYGDNDVDTFTEDLKVMAGTSPSADDMSIDIANYSAINSGAAIQELITFTVPADGVYYFGFNAYSSANQYFIYVDDIHVDIALSTPGIENDKFSYYPNPVKNVLTLTNTKNITSVEVYNMIGQRLIVKNDNSTTSKVDMSALPNGSYVVKMTADGMTKTVKVLKQ